MTDDLFDAVVDAGLADDRVDAGVASCGYDAADGVSVGVSSKFVFFTRQIYIARLKTTGHKGVRGNKRGTRERLREAPDGDECELEEVRDEVVGEGFELITHSG